MAFSATESYQLPSYTITAGLLALIYNIVIRSAFSRPFPFSSVPGNDYSLHLHEFNLLYVYKSEMKWYFFFCVWNIEKNVFKFYLVDFLCMCIFWFFVIVLVSRQGFSI